MWIPSTSNALTDFSATSCASQIRFHVIASFFDCPCRRARTAHPRSDRPVRALVQSTVFDPNLAAQKDGSVAFDLERVVVLPDQEQSTLSGIDMRIDAVEQVLIDDHR